GLSFLLLALGFFFLHLLSRKFLRAFVAENRGRAATLHPCLARDVDRRRGLQSGRPQVGRRHPRVIRGERLGRKSRRPVENRRRGWRTIRTSLQGAAGPAAR